MKKYKIILSIKSENPNLPDWGLGKGVLSSQEAEYKDDISNIHLNMSLNDIAENLIKETIDIKFEEI